MVFLFGAGDEARTRYLDLGKVALYQMSYARKRKVNCSRKHAACQPCIFIFCKKAGSIMYLQGADLRKEALCPVIFIQRKGEQRHESNWFSQILFQG